MTFQSFAWTFVATAVLAAVATNVQAKDWKVIRFGTESSYAPFEYKTPDGKLTGFDVDLGLFLIHT
ncbi:transporter substrate-binding domain-containing protein, partial [Acinetobacter baumannii]|uniref:transporter substrate-binding domain-containing protein n=1 Tax=Acinetobacter baumannii TaxID=470 RepID=UPI0039810CE6